MDKLQQWASYKAVGEQLLGMSLAEDKDYESAFTSKENKAD